MGSYNRKLIFLNELPFEIERSFVIFISKNALYILKFILSNLDTTYTLYNRILATYGNFRLAAAINHIDYTYAKLEYKDRT